MQLPRMMQRFSVLRKRTAISGERWGQPAQILAGKGFTEPNGPTAPWTDPTWAHHGALKSREALRLPDGLIGRQLRGRLLLAGAVEWPQA
jgi:hypothetical protein